ncbi:MAG: hypothetical protein LIO59_03225, partial [Oscillospiraceae bacterium]|nr:hypothetical protein [Oscillospiraceae bacterium]
LHNRLFPQKPRQKGNICEIRLCVYFPYQVILSHCFQKIKHFLASFGQTAHLKMQLINISGKNTN